MEVILSESRDPYFNLAWEDAFLGKGYEDRSIFFLYINDPCIVVGRNQCHYKEVNHRYWDYPGCPVVRRVSGGGTVYHDRGNLNFAFIKAHDNRLINGYRELNRPLFEALSNAGLSLEYDARNNLLYRGKKISGNAQFTNRNRMISHGTLLVNAKLDQLRASLRKNPFEVQSKSVASVPSPVINLAESGRFSNAENLLEYLSGEMGSGSIEFLKADKLPPSFDQYRSSDWNLSRSPDCTIQSASGSWIEISKARIVAYGSTEERYSCAIDFTQTKRRSEEMIRLRLLGEIWDELFSDSLLE